MTQTASTVTTPFIDLHFLSALAESRVVVFTQDDIEQAETEWQADQRVISSVCRSGIQLGLTCNDQGDQRWFSAYANGFWLGILAATSTPDGGSRNTFWTISVPPAALAAMGTEQEEVGRRVCELFSIVEGLSHNNRRPQPAIENEIAELVEQLRPATTTKKSLHCTEQTLETLKAGGHTSGRVNAIVGRYAALTADPQLAGAMALTEQIERDLQQQKK